MAEMQSRTFQWKFDCSVEEIWPLLANTERFNEAAELPKHDIEEIARDDGSVDFVARAPIGPFTLVWDEEPTNWVANKWFRHRRNFRNGPFKSLCATLKLFPDGPGRSRGEYTLDIEPANMLGRLMLRAGFFEANERKFTRMVGEANDYCAGRRDQVFETKPPKLHPGAREKLQVAASRIEDTGLGHGLADRLADHLINRLEVDVRRIRPLNLAREWDVPERHVIELCMQAARENMLALRWDLLCPRCQAGKASSSRLDELPKQAHCSTCNITYDRDYSKNIELAFFPSSQIRAVDDRTFCLFGPWSTPHVALQITVEAGETRKVEAGFAHGMYRLRTLQPGPETSLSWRRGGFPGVVARCDGIDIGGESEPGIVQLCNATERPLTLIVEELHWRRDALTAHRALSMQAFRDLFDEEILRPGDNLEIDSVTFIFVDLQSSTALYEKVGDFQAYRLVREFFAVLAGAIRASNGSIVKTIGDAVHGAFANPKDALDAAVRIQQDIKTFNAKSGKTPIGVKVGLHAGRCIIVTLNNRLDYYGTAVNKASRLADQSGDGDIVISQEFASDPTIKPALEAFRLKKDSAQMKGFNEPMAFYRLRPKEARKPARRTG